MKPVALFFGQVPLLYYFLALATQDYLLFTLKTLSNFRQAPYVIGSLKSLLFRYYLLLMLLVTTAALARRLYAGRFGHYDAAAYSILRIYAYVFLAINAVNEWHQMYSDELTSLSSKRWASVLAAVQVAVFVANCKLTFQFHSSVDDDEEAPQSA